MPPNSIRMLLRLKHLATAFLLIFWVAVFAVVTANLLLQHAWLAAFVSLCFLTLGAIRARQFFGLALIPDRRLASSPAVDARRLPGPPRVPLRERPGGTGQIGTRLDRTGFMTRVLLLVTVAGAVALVVRYVYRLYR